MNRNIVYRTDQLARYFARNRIKWSQFYESERVVIGGLGLDGEQRILDIGCGCGGLGLALLEQFGVQSYTGVEINREAAEVARQLNPRARILCGDILELTQTELRRETFSHVFSLSCVDWNVRFGDMLAAAWAFVQPQGHLVATFRLVNGNGCSDMDRSYQFINCEGVREGERAAYIVLNGAALLRTLLAFDPIGISAYGYWGPPSVTAVTPYERLCFAAFAITRRRQGETAETRFDLKLPTDLDDAVGAL